MTESLPTSFLSVFKKCWQSPTLMTYGSFFARTLSSVILLPLVLIYFDTEEINLWFFFSAVLALQLVVEFGFSPSFARAIAYARAGVDVSRMTSDSTQAKSLTDGSLQRRVCSTMGYVYSRLSAVWFFLLIIVGSIAVYRPIMAMDNPEVLWIAWFIVVTTSTVSFLGFAYSTYLQGAKKVAVVRRWEIVFTLLSTGTSAAILATSGDFFLMIFAQRLWALAKFYRDKRLTSLASDNQVRIYKSMSCDRKILKSVWPVAWRTGLGAMTGVGVVQLSGIVYAQVASPSESATYFLALRLIQVVNQFSRAPFYSRIPEMTSLYAEGKRTSLLVVARDGMRLSYASFLLGFGLLAIAGDLALEFIGSNAQFPPLKLWFLLGLAFLFERYGAMHLNLYSTSNKVANHVANGVTGLVFILLALVLYESLNVYAFPVALAIGNVAFYSWYSAMHSMKEFELQFHKFESTVFFPFALVFLLACIACLLDVI